MSERLLLVESDWAGLRAALLVDRRLEAIEIDRAAQPSPVGSVLPATFVRTVKGLGSFIRLGEGDQMMLDSGRIKGLPEAGQTLTVQITRAPQGSKLGIASRSVALSGRGTIHLPFESGVSISRRLDLDTDRRASLEALVAGRTGGWIFRRNAGRIDSGDLAAEIAALVGEGQAARIDGAHRPPPNAFRRLVTDSMPPPDRIVAAGLAARRTVERWCHAFAPSLLERVEHADAGLFDLHDLDSAIAALGDPRAPLAGGGSLFIQHTEALTVVDVNAGALTDLLSVNLSAAAEIARQLRLRHIGGLLVIDFISLTRPTDRDRTVEALKAAVADDPAQTHILPMSAFGLVEMTRERRGPGLELDA